MFSDNNSIKSTTSVGSKNRKTLNRKTLNSAKNRKTLRSRGSIKQSSIKQNEKTKLINILDELIVTNELSFEKGELYFKKMVKSEDYELSFKKMNTEFSAYLNVISVNKKVNITMKYINSISDILNEFQNENKDDKNIILLLDYFNNNTQTQNGGASSNISVSNTYRYLLSFFQQEMPDYTIEHTTIEYNNYQNQFKRDLMFFYYPLLVLLLLMPDNIIDLTGKITLSGKLFLFLYRKYTINMGRIEGVGRRRRSSYRPQLHNKL